jgi:metallopeptidase MepB
MFEHFLWNSTHMTECSMHYTYLDSKYLAAWQTTNPGRPRPPKKLPPDMIDRLIEAHNVCVADDMLGRLHRSFFDLHVHSPPRHEDVCNNRWISDQWKKWGAISQYWGWDQVESVGYTHSRLYVGGYDAYYYCYVFCKVWASDLYETGFKADTLNPENGKRYRELVLKPGGSKKPMEILRDFLGREPNAEAFCKDLGLEARQILVEAD